MINVERNQRDQVHEELKQVLTILREKKQIQRRETTGVTASTSENTSLPFEIQTWTEQKSPQRYVNKKI